MSLATGGGGGFSGGGGLSAAAMAHGPNSAMAMHRAHAQPPPGAEAPPGMTAAPGTSYAALGADLIDKNQNLTLKGVKNMAELPIVAVDLYGGGEVSYFPPIGEDGEGGETVSGGRPIKVRSMGRLGSGSGTEKGLSLKRNDDVAYRAVRRLLSKSRGVDAVIDNAIVDDVEEKGSSSNDVLTIPRPYLLLGARRTANLTADTLNKFEVEEDDNSPAISEESAAPKGGVSLRNATLDGSSNPTGDDFDRVAVRLTMHSGKKPLSILPEEVVGIMVARAKRLVHRSWIAGGGEEVEVLPEKGEDDDEEDAYLPYPVAYAVPGWACIDSAVEALLDSSASGPNPAVAYQRSVAALVGSLLPRERGSKHKLHSLLGEEVKRLREAFEKELREADDDDEGKASPSQSAFQPLVLAVGVTADGLELSAAQLSGVSADPHCPFGDVNIIANVNYRSETPFNLLEKAMGELREKVGRNLPESPGPCALITYGTVGMQVKLKTSLTKLLKSYAVEAEKNNVDDDDDDGFDERISIVSTGEECVAEGLSVLAASSHGRIYHRETEGKKKAKRTLNVHDVAATAVGMRMNYHSDEDENKWSKVKVVFDFDRRVPAGPYQVELTAAECAAFRAKADDVDFDDDNGEKLEAAMKKFEGGKMIPKREEAARGFKLQIVQMSERGGAWMPVGDIMKPLTIEDSQADDKESDEGRVACESAVLELSVGAAGIITSTLMSDG
mmetsp:Transcript_19981/g.29260  ORF Transcript_19981/g.29260 Transcript_19981/m.29260 type:complete len:726 (+) Transcript_19981:171-2348(+)